MDFLEESQYKDFSGVYCIYCKTTNKKYIGSTVNTFSKRRSQHLYLLNKLKHHSPKLQRAWNKYGNNSFSFYVIEVLQRSEKSLIREREKYWMDLLDTFNKGLNCSEKTEGRISTNVPSGEDVYNAVLTNERVRELKNYYESGESIRDLSKRLKISTHTIRCAILGKTYKTAHIEPVKIRETRFFGEKASTSKISDMQATEVINRYKNGEKISCLSLEFGLSISSTRKLCNGISYRHLPIERKHLKLSELRTKYLRRKVMSEDERRTIKKLLMEDKLSQRDIAKMFGRTEVYISKLKIENRIVRKYVYNGKTFIHNTVF